MAESQIEKQIRERIDVFLEDISELVRAAAVEAVGKALGGDVLAPTQRGPGRPRKSATGGTGATPKTGRRKKRQRVYRTTAQIEAIKADIVAHLKANPGERMEHISAALKMPTKDVRGPMLKLAAEKKVRMTGQKRGARHFVKPTEPIIDRRYR